MRCIALHVAREQLASARLGVPTGESLVAVTEDGSEGSVGLGASADGLETSSSAGSREARQTECLYRAKRADRHRSGRAECTSGKVKEGGGQVVAVGTIELHCGEDRSVGSQCFRNCHGARFGPF